MIKFIKNTGDYFSSNYFDEEFSSKVLKKSGHTIEAIKEFNKKVTPVKERFLRFKQLFIEGKLRIKDKVFESHKFHTHLLNTLGYDGNHTQYNQMFPLSEQEVIPVRHILYRGNQPHLMIMEMQALIKEGDTEPDGLFEQRYNVEDEEQASTPQRYHRSQWERIPNFQIPENCKISPSIINKAISQLFLLEQHYRPKYILLLAGNIVFLLEQEKWFRGSYLEFDLEELFSEDTALKSANYFALFYFLVSKESLAPESNMVLLAQLDEDSHKSAYEVTQDLKEGIIHAVEALANEALYYQKEKLQEVFDETDDTFEQQIKDDCLRIIYRMLFIFYAESREDLDILPSNDPIYNKGYSLEMLRELEQVPLYSVNSLDGYFFHESLSKLFKVLSSGYRENEVNVYEKDKIAADKNIAINKSFHVRHIDSPIFDNGKLHHLHKVKFRNRVWQDIICRLSLSKEKRNRPRGRISYANLGINQLGSVYESLLAFRGFYAEQDYIEVHKKDKPEEGTYLVPRSRRDDFEEEEILKDDNQQDVIIKKGLFVYRLSGRDRQKSASYYTPEVLTQCVVKYTLKPFLEKLEKGEMKALELLDLKLLEPAMGAAAFHNEMINQIAEVYVSYRQKELRDTGRIEWRIEPDKYKEELQKVKAYIATNNTYGVDLNPTAIELGKLSLWLNVIHKDMETPFFSNRLCVGNAVVGAWLKVYKDKDLAEELDAVGRPLTRQPKKEWWEKAPRQLEFKPNTNYEKIKTDRKANEIYHFLVPDKNMVPSVGIKMLKDENPQHAQRVTAWKKEWIKPLSKSEIEKLKTISNSIDDLLAEYYRFQRNINLQTGTKQNIFGAAKHAEQAVLQMRSYDEKEKLADQRNRHSAPYFKLKMVMDYWCSLWFWDMRQAEELPNRQQYWQDIANILQLDLNKIINEQPPKSFADGIQKPLFYAGGEQLKIGEDGDEAPKLFEEAVIEYADRRDMFDKNQRLDIVNQLAKKYFFFHPQLEFLEVFWERGGFDLIAGNPPWVVISYDRLGLLSDRDPLHIVKESETNVVDEYIEELTKNDSVFKIQRIEHLMFVECLKNYVNAKVNFELLNGQKPNLHKLIVENTMILGRYFGIIHDKGIYDDSSGQLIRNKLFKRLNFLFQFQNELPLFQGVGNTKKFEISIGSPLKGGTSFYSINNLFHPSTIYQSFAEKSKEILGIRNKEGGWELKGNSTRIIYITDEVLKFYNNLLQDESEWSETKLPLLHSNLLLESLKILDSYGKKLINYKNEITPTIMLDETKGKRQNILENNPGFVTDKEFVLASIHYYNGNPIFQTPNENCANHRDNSRVDLLSINEDYLPRTVYRLKIDSKILNNNPNYFYTQRKRAQISNERTLITSIQPPFRVHTDNSYSLHFTDEFKMLTFAIFSFSIIYDFYVKSTGRENIYFDTVANLPLVGKPNPYIITRGLHLTCVTKKYEDLWNKYSKYIPLKDKWSKKSEILSKTNFSLLNSEWSFLNSFKSEYARRQALVEIDVLVSMELGLSLNQLLTIYSVVFGVLQSNEQELLFDSNGRVVPSPIKKQISGEKSQKILFNGIEYSAPFIGVNRVEDYKIAWEYFENIF